MTPGFSPNLPQATVVITAPVTQEFLDQACKHFHVLYLAEAVQVIEKYLPAADCLIIRSEIRLDQHLLKLAPNLKLIGRLGVGVDNIDIVYCQQNAINIFYFPGVSARSVAELGICLMINAARRVVDGSLSLKNGAWRKADLLGNELSDMTLGIIGYGHIGKQLAKIARPLFKCINVCKKHTSGFTRLSLWLRGITLASKVEILKNCDVIVLALPLTNETRFLIGADEIKFIKKHAILVNLSRQDIVRESDLVSVLENGDLIYCSDVTALKGNAFHEQPNTVLTPHLGAQTHQVRKRIEDETLKILSAFFIEGSIKPEPSWFGKQFAIHHRAGRKQSRFI